MKQPLVSVLMTAYNREKYIAEAIESVLASSYTNWELIVVDDQSLDNTVAIAKSYAFKDTRIRVYINEKNLGDYRNRNQAAAYANGVYLKYLDADDMIYPHGIEAMVNAMQQFPEAAYGFSFFGEQDDTVKYPILYTPEQAYNEHFLVKSFFYQGPGGAIIRKKFFDEVGGFSGKRYIGDTELWLKLSLKNNCIVFWPTLIWWRKHEQQENVHESKDYEALVSRHLLLIDFLKQDNPMSVDQNNRAILNFTRIYCHKIIRFFLSGNFEASNVLLKGYPVSAAKLLLSLIPINRINRMFIF